MKYFVRRYHQDLRIPIVEDVVMIIAYPFYRTSLNMYIFYAYSYWQGLPCHAALCEVGGRPKVMRGWGVGCWSDNPPSKTHLVIYSLLKICFKPGSDFQETTHICQKNLRLGTCNIRSRDIPEAVDRLKNLIGRRSSVVTKDAVERDQVKLDMGII